MNYRKWCLAVQLDLGDAVGMHETQIFSASALRVESCVLVYPFASPFPPSFDFVPICYATMLHALRFDKVRQKAQRSSSTVNIPYNMGSSEHRYVPLGTSTARPWRVIDSNTINCPLARPSPLGPSNLLNKLIQVTTDKKKLSGWKNERMKMDCEPHPPRNIATV